MNLELYVENLNPDDDLERFVRCRAELALRPLRDRFDSASVFVRRRDDARPGAAVRCLVVVRSGTRADLVVERFDGNVYVAIHRAIDEAGWALADSCAREQDGFLERQLMALGVNPALPRGVTGGVSSCAA